MKIEKKVSWITQAFANMNPVFATIKRFKQIETDKGKEERIVVEINEKLYDWTIYGDTFNFLIDQLGDETDLWLQQRLKLLRVQNSQSGKHIIKVEVIKN